MDMKNNGLQLNLFDEEETEPAIPEKQYDHTQLFERLAQSAFRSKFRLSVKDKAYIQGKHSSTRHRLLLPGMLCQMALHSCRPGAYRRRTAICGECADGVD